MITRKILYLKNHVLTLQGYIERALTFPWSMWRRSLISLNVLLASIILSNALPIFLIATCSCVSELKAALKRNIVQVNINHFQANIKFMHLNLKKEIKHLPDYAINASTNRANRRHILGRHLEQVSIHIVMCVFTTMGENPFDFSIPRSWRSGRRAWPFCGHVQGWNSKSKGS